jgi:hypothetical protein
MIVAFMSRRLFADRPAPQRIIHYRGRRPFMALFLIACGYLIGYIASRDCSPGPVQYFQPQGVTR